MDFQQAFTQYQSLLAMFQSGQLSQQDFYQQVAQLQVTDAQGVAWSINPENGQWLKWDGNRWVNAQPPFTQAPPPQAPPQAPPQPGAGQNQAGPGPRNTIQLLGLIVKRIPGALLRKLPLAIGLGAAVWVIHTFLLVGPNGGFNPAGIWWLDRTLALSGKILSGTLFWMLLTYLIPALIRGSKKAGGLGKLFQNIFQNLGKALSPLSSNDKSGMPYLVLGFALATFLSWMWRNSFVSLQMFITISMSIVAFSITSFPYILAKTVQSDLHKAFKGDSVALTPISVQNALILFGGMSVGMLVTTLPVLERLGHWIGIAAFILFFAVKSSGNKGNTTTIALLVFAFISAMQMVFPELAMADDGGASECGGYWNVFTLQCEGAGRAYGIGVPAAAGAAVGPFIYEIFNDLVSLPPGWTDAPPPPMPPGGGDVTPPPTPTTTSTPPTPPTEGTTPPVPPTTPDVKVEDPGKSPWEQMFEDVKTNSGIVSNTFGIKQIGDGMRKILDKSFTLYKPSAEMSQKYLEFMTNNPTLMNNGDEIVDIYFGLKDIEGTELLTSVKNSSKSAQIMDGIGKAGAVMDGLWSTYQNCSDTKLADGSIIEGDNLLYGGAKGATTAYINFAAGNANPALGVMDLTNTFAFGGTEASKIIGPGDTITGSFNFLADSVKDMINGTDNATQLLQNGKYGGALQNIADGAELGGELLGQWTSDPEQAQEIADVLTDDGMWEGMYDSSYQMWKPPADAGMLKTGACAAGELATNTIIGVGEVTAKVGEAVGNMAGEASVAVEQAVTSTIDTVKDVASSTANAVSSAASAVGNAASAVKNKIFSWF